MAHYDDYGRFYIVDRYKQLIKYKGIQVGDKISFEMNKPLTLTRGRKHTDTAILRFIYYTVMIQRANYTRCYTKQFDERSTRPMRQVKSRKSLLTIYQVIPSYLENLLLTHPAVADAGVIGLPDERAGELPAAFVVLKAGVTATEADIKTFVDGGSIGDFFCVPIVGGLYEELDKGVRGSLPDIN